MQYKVTPETIIDTKFLPPILHNLCLPNLTRNPPANKFFATILKEMFLNGTDCYETEIKEVKFDIVSLKQ